MILLKVDSTVNLPFLTISCFVFLSFVFFLLTREQHHSVTDQQLLRSPGGRYDPVDLLGSFHFRLSVLRVAVDRKASLWTGSGSGLCRSGWHHMAQPHLQGALQLWGDSCGEGASWYTVSVHIQCLTSGWGAVPLHSHRVASDQHRTRAELGEDWREISHQDSHGQNCW